MEFRYYAFVKVNGKWERYGLTIFNDNRTARAIEEEIFNCEEVRFERIEK